MLRKAGKFRLRLWGYRTTTAASRLLFVLAGGRVWVDWETAEFMEEGPRDTPTSLCPLLLHIWPAPRREIKVPREKSEGIISIILMLRKAGRVGIATLKPSDDPAASSLMFLWFQRICQEIAIPHSIGDCNQQQQTSALI